MNAVISASDKPTTLFGRTMQHIDSVDLPQHAKDRIFRGTDRDYSSKSTSNFDFEETSSSKKTQRGFQSEKEVISEAFESNEGCRVFSTDLKDFGASSESKKNQLDGASSVRFDKVLDTVKQKFPDLRVPTELAMSIVASLSLVDLDKCPTAFLEGKPAVGKTTTLRFFYPSKNYDNGLNLSYKSDDFTPAAFVSQDASKKSENLEKVDLLPRIKDQVFLTPDANTIFERGGEDETKNALSTVSRIIDGEGYSRDAGTHGQRGYSGDYKFVWLGATTPLKDWHYRMMGNLGSRILMIPVESSNRSDEKIAEEILKGDYKKRVKECRKAVSGYLNSFFDKNGIQQVSFDRANIKIKHVNRIAKFGRFIADFRRKKKKEDPMRVTSLLFDIARGHALLNGRKHLVKEDVDILIPMVYGSVPKVVQVAFKRIMENDKVTVKDLLRYMEISKPTALKKLRELDEEWNLVYKDTEDVRGGKTVVGKPTSDYRWIKKL